MVFHLAGWSPTSIVPTIFLNMLFLLSSIAVGLYLHKKKEGYSQGNALSDIKSGMTVGIPYALVVVVFIYLYYTQINPGFVEMMVNEKLTAYKTGLSDPEQLKLIKASNEAFEVMDANDIYREMEQSTRATISAKSIALISLLGMVLLSAFYSILITIIYRRVLLRDLK